MSIPRATHHLSRVGRRFSPPPALLAPLCCLLSAATLASCEKAAAPSPAVAPRIAVSPRPLVLSDAAVIGASVSAGAEVEIPGLASSLINGAANLADALAALSAPGAAPPKALASVFFFTRPGPEADRQIAAAKEAKAPLVFALDFLFWHAYGDKLSGDRRRALFEQGLSRLDSLGPDITVVVADIPDMSHAIGVLLAPGEVPPPAIQESLNAHLADWAKSRPNIVLVPLRTLVNSAINSKTVTLGGHTFDGFSARALLAPSGLHTTASGLVALALECLDRLNERALLPPGSTWQHDHAAALKLLIQQQQRKFGVTPPK